MTLSRPHALFRSAAVTGAAVFFLGLAFGAGRSARSVEFGGFVIEKDVLVDVSPAEAFEAFTGDITAWWDHSFSDKPFAMILEPRPGGSFLELFDEAGNGLQHARVTWAEPGRKLVMRGPLAFHDRAFEMVHTFTFEAEGESTRLRAVVHAAGECEDGWEAAVTRAWEHFLVERFKPFAEREE